MYEYIKGTVTSINDNYIVLENNEIGYLINVANSYSFNTNEKYTIYIHEYIKEDENSLYGFKTKEEKEFFLRLIEVKGLGCKMALPMFNNNSVENIIKAIENDDINYLKKFPKIGDKVARQIVLDLKGKLVTKTNINNNELSDALKALGYKSKDIEDVISKIDSKKILEEQIKDALKLLRK